MENASLQELIKHPPLNVPWPNPELLEQMEQRRNCVEMVQGTIIWVNRDEYEFVPDNEPPSEAEVLAWIWFIRPDLMDDISEYVSEDMKEMMQSYKDGEIDKWIQNFAN
ncbi:MAG: hypothetical protein JW927_22850 [Deltaproteobacteria bacterium]|nr:hypothetical protein [Deltaproteobacteria bacterium]